MGGGTCSHLQQRNVFECLYTSTSQTQSPRFMRIIFIFILFLATIYSCGACGKKKFANQKGLTQHIRRQCKNRQSELNKKPKATKIWIQDGENGSRGQTTTTGDQGLRGGTNGPEAGPSRAGPSNVCSITLISRSLIID